MFNVPPGQPRLEVRAEMAALASRLDAGHDPQEAHKSTASALAAHGHHLASRIHNIIAMAHEHGAYSSKLNVGHTASVGKSWSGLQRKEKEHAPTGTVSHPSFHYSPSSKGGESYTYHTDTPHPNQIYHPGSGWSLRLPDSMGGSTLPIDQPPDHLHKQIMKHLDKHESYVLERANKPVKIEAEQGKDYPVADKAE